MKIRFIISILLLTSCTMKSAKVLKLLLNVDVFTQKFEIIREDLKNEIRL